MEAVVLVDEEFSQFRLRADGTLHVEGPDFGAHPVALRIGDGWTTPEKENLETCTCPSGTHRSTTEVFSMLD